MAMTRRSRWLALGSASMVLVLAAGFMTLRGGSTTLSPESAVARFRDKQQVAIADEKQSASTADAPVASSSKRVQAKVTTEISSGSRLRPRPVEGVYVYATTGGDDVDVLGGSRHTYPSETTITVRHDGCGLVERWDALEERWDERESCRTPGGDRLKRTTSFHEFFGRADERTLKCDGFTYPAAANPGDTWPMSCASDNTRTSMTLAAVGWEDVDVAGSKVRTLHVRVDIRITGEQQGRATRDVWGSVDTGLSVRERATLTSYSNQPVFGRTRYHESYELRLTSLEPRR